MELTQDELRIIQERRATLSLQSGSEQIGDSLVFYMRSIRHFARMGKVCDPHDPLWDKLLELVPEVK